MTVSAAVGKSGQSPSCPPLYAAVTMRATGTAPRAVMATGVAKRIPAGRIGVDEDMAAGAICLASRAGDYVVEETITVHGRLVNASPGGSIDN